MRFRRFILALAIGALASCGGMVPAYAQIQPPPTRWNTIGNPAANKTFQMNGRSTVWNVGSSTGSANLFTFTDDAANTAATGVLVNIAPASKSTCSTCVIPLQVVNSRNASQNPNIRLKNAGGQVTWDLRTTDVSGFGTAQIVSGNRFAIYTDLSTQTDNSLAFRADAGTANREVWLGCHRTMGSGTEVCFRVRNASNVANTQNNNPRNANGPFLAIYNNAASSPTPVAAVTHNGFDSRTGGYAVWFPNEIGTGTCLNCVVKLSGSPGSVKRTDAGDTTGAVGIAVEGTGTSGDAKVVVAGKAWCVFDGATTAHNYVQISSTTAGACTDAGASFPASGQVLGRVLSTNGAAGTYQILLQIQR